MRIAIMGTGGVGGYFGARLAHAGADVNLPADDAEDRMAFCDQLPATMISSMHHDLQRAAAEGTA